MSFRHLNFRHFILLNLSLTTILSVALFLSQNLNFQLVCLFLWFFQVLACVLYVQWRGLRESGEHFVCAQSKREKVEIFFLLLASGLISFLFLTDYPFHTIGDGLRDLGLLYQKLERGELKLFGYGYAGNPALVVIPLLSPFYKIFGATALSMRFPGALISILDVFIFYLALRKAGLRNYAFVGALLLACDRFHLYFARTEQLVLISSLFASLALYGFAQLANKLTLPRVAFLSLLMGFSTAFMASVIVIYVFSMVFLFVIIGSETLVKKRQVKKFFAYVAVTLSCFAVGVGPRAAVSNFDFMTAQLKKQQKQSGEPPVWARTQVYLERYVQSVDAFFYQKRGKGYKHFRDYDPFLDKMAFFLFVAGLIYCFVRMRRNSFFKVLLAFLFLIIFFNSAFTNGIAFDNRVLTIIPFFIFVMTAGVQSLSNLFIQHRERVVMVGNILVFFYASYRGIQFFAEQRASLSQFGAAKFATGKPGDSDAYLPFLLGNVMRVMQSEFRDQSHICVTANDSILKYFRLRHNRENFSYYGNQKTVQYVKNDALDDLTVHMSTGCPVATTSLEKTLTFCEEKKLFVCPENSGINDGKPFRIVVFGSSRGLTAGSIPQL